MHSFNVSWSLTRTQWSLTRTQWGQHDEEVAKGCVNAFLRQTECGCVCVANASTQRYKNVSCYL